MKDRYDIIIVGAGHAGIEAARAASSLGCTVGLMIMDPTRTGAMACNPSVGGPAKGHLTREIDALGGVQAIAADRCATHRRMLNTSKGPAVRALRVQVDKSAYQLFMYEYIGSLESVDLIPLEATSLSFDKSGVKAVLTPDGKIGCQAVILAAGTFLRGKIHI